LFHFLGSIRYLQQYRSAIKKDKGGEEDIITAAIHYMRENVEKKSHYRNLPTT